MVNDLVKLALVNQVASLQLCRYSIGPLGNLIILDTLIVKLLIEHVDLFGLFKGLLLSGCDSISLICDLVFEDDDAFFKALDMNPLLVGHLFLFDQLLLKAHLLVDDLLLD